VVRIVCQLASLPALILWHGFPAHVPLLGPFAPFAFPLLASILTVLPVVEWRLSLVPSGYWPAHPTRGVMVAGAVLGAVVLAAEPGRLFWLESWSEFVVLLWGLQGLLRLFGRVSSAGWNAAAVLVLSFVTVDLVGTMLLMLPRCQAAGDGGGFRTAVFTSTSAVCVTGLAVVDTGTHWSREGQAVILVLIQIGGLGIMTFGAFFALIIGRGLVMSEAVLVADLLESKTLGSVKRLIVAILVFTLGSEAAGAALLWGLWPDLPFGERLFHCVFHSVSAFCNAGFALMPNNFEGMGTRWQVWGVLAGLIIVGGLGFTTLYNLYELTAHRLSHRSNSLFRVENGRPHLRLSTRLALGMTFILLVGGTVAIYLLELGRWSETGSSAPERLSAAWFQSVSCRTAGFNTVAINSLTEATKFVMIVLMAIGASPGSTGGGLKTTNFAVILFALRAILRGREQVEVNHKTIPMPLVLRALLIGALGIMLATGLTLLVVAFESISGKFLAHLFEVTSALATVGLSTGVTDKLSAGSHWILIVGMFLGRVGPLTLLVALAGRGGRGRYTYPEERVLLG
jgi:trk system potassium uptake protein TrkH